MFRFLLPYIFVFTSAFAQETTSITLTDAKQFAARHNYEVDALRKAVQVMKAEAHRSRSAFFPTLGIAGGLDGQTTGGESNTGVVGYGYGQYNLFNGYRDTFQSRLADLEVQRAELDLRAAEFRVGLEVEEQFHLYLYNKIQIDFKQSELALNETHRKSVQRRRMAGAVVESDVLEFDLKASILQADLQSLAQDVAVAKVNLKRLLGEDVSDKMEPIGVLRHLHLKPSLGKCLEKVREKNTGIQSSAREVEAQQLAFKITNSRWLPRLDLETQVGFLPQEQGAEERRVTAKFQLIAKIDLFNGFDTQWEREAISARISKAESLLKEDILVTLSKVEEVFRKAKAIEERVDLESQNSERSEKYYKAVMREYERGAKNSADVSAAASGLFEAKLRRERFKYEFLVLLVELQKTVGDVIETEVIAEKMG